MSDIVRTTIDAKARLEHWERRRRQAALSMRLAEAGLKPTRQRMVLGELLLCGPHRHVTAEELHAEAKAAGAHVSIATVYNTLHCFSRAGLLRQVAVDGGKAFFDTNTSDHNHFYFERQCRMLDIPDGLIRVEGLPPPPAGMRISHIDVVVRLVEGEDDSR